MGVWPCVQVGQVCRGRKGVFAGMGVSRCIQFDWENICLLFILCHVSEWMKCSIGIHEIHSMKINTIPGAHYALTCTTGCSVKAIRNDGREPLTILEVSSAGQFGFTAPTETVEVSDEHALVTQTFKGAALGSSAQDGGIKNGEDAVLNNLAAQSGTFSYTVNANGGVNIPVAPSTDTEAARYREVRLLHEMEFSALRTYFNSSNPFSWGILVDRFWWAAGRDNMPAWTVVTADFNMINLDNNNSAYDGLTSCYFPMSCGLGYGRCFDSIAIGNTSFNADYASLDDDPFATPAGYMRYWVDIQIGRPANGQCAVSVRMSRWDNASSTAVNTTHQCSVPDSLALRGVALSMTSKHSGVWLVGFDKSAGRLVSYKVLSETFTLDSYNRAMSSRLSLAKTAGHCSVGVHAPNYYGGTVLGEWCDLIQIN